MTKDGGRHLRAVHEDWRALATALNARMEQMRLGQREVALAAGISVATLRVLQRGGGSRRVQDSTLIAVSHAVGWSDHHLIRVLLGELYPEPARPRRRHQETVAQRPRRPNPTHPRSEGSEKPPSPEFPDLEPVNRTSPDRDGADRDATGRAEPGFGRSDGGPHAAEHVPVSLLKAPLDVSERILITLLRIERGVAGIAEHLARR
jgi:hypothetical protein